MNISYKWLKEYVDFDLTAEQVCDALTSLGLEVDALSEVQAIKGGLKGLYVGKVLSCQEHPDSDHLHVTMVDLGRQTPSQIVCGAPNVREGQKVIVADIGCVLYDGDKEFTIRKSKLRGVESCGMICAEDEIGIGDDHSGIIVLPDDAPVGQEAAKYYNIESDYLLEIDITANRADALSHYGVARDLYAWLVSNGYQTRLHRPSCDDFKVDNHDLPIEITIENTQACKRYAAVSITDCEVKESPKWLQDKLQILGLRPINNIVDITNYIMMAYGQPLHCFDADMVLGHHIIVKTMPEGTPFVTLDGQEHKLGPNDLAICNSKEPMCIAGVFGGKGSGTYETTRSVVLESAYFHPTWIRKSAKRHSLSTDASFRFERGVDPDGIIYALKQAAILCKSLAHGKISMEIRDVYPEEIPNAKVSLKYDYLNSLIGKVIEKEKVKEILKSLEIKIENESEETLDLIVPAYRVDVNRSCDVVEDILRVYGYNNVEIPGQLKSSLVIKTQEDKAHKKENLISEQLVGSGFNEIMNNSLTKSAYYENLNSFPKEKLVRIINPLSSDLNVMRETLLFGGLESISYNTNRKSPNLKFFEFGHVYQKDPEKKNSENPLSAYSESTHLGLWLTGKRVENSWAHPDEDSSFYELKAYVNNIFSRIGLTLKDFSSSPSSNDVFLKGIQIKNHQEKILAEIGILKSSILKDFAIENPVYFAEIDWTLAFKATRKKQISFTEISKYPSVSRDLALLIDKNVEFERIKNIAFRTEKKFLKSVKLFDVYEGKNLPQGKKSYAVNFILQDEEKTLNDKQIDAIMNKLIGNLKSELNAELR